MFMLKVCNWRHLTVEFGTSNLRCIAGCVLLYAIIIQKRLEGGTYYTNIWIFKLNSHLWVYMHIYTTIYGENNIEGRHIWQLVGGFSFKLLPFELWYVWTIARLNYCRHDAISCSLNQHICLLIWTIILPQFSFKIFFIIPIKLVHDN